MPTLVHTVSADQPRPAQHIVIPEFFPYRFNAEHGDTITLVMLPDSANLGSTWVDRCNDAGGEPIYNPYTDIATCDDVDF